MAERFGDGGTAALQMLDAEISRQALMISYIDIFHAMSDFYFLRSVKHVFAQADAAWPNRSKRTPAVIRHHSPFSTGAGLVPTVILRLITLHRAALRHSR